MFSTPRGSVMLAAAATLLLLNASLAYAALFPANSKVVQLTGRTFKAEVLDIEKPTMVAFTAPWCGHCQRLAPAWDKAASKLEGVVKFANIDCDADPNKALCGQYGIRGFPTLKLFPATKKRIPRDYNGERTAKDFVRFASEQFPQTARKLGAEEIGPYFRSHPERPKILLFSNKPTSSALFRSLALDYRRSLPFAWTRGDAGLARSNARLELGLDIPTAENLPVLVMLPAKAIKGAFETYEGAMRYRDIKAWIDKTGAKMGADLSGKGNFDALKAPKADKAAKSKPKPSRKPIADEDIPKGGSVEWKVQPSDPDVPGMDKVRERLEMLQAAAGQDATYKEGSGGDGGMLKKSRAEEVLEQIEKQKEKAKEALKGTADAILGEESLGDKARKLAEDAAGLASDAAELASDAIKGATDAVGDVVESLAEKLGHAGKLAGSATGGPFEAKRKALMGSFEKWMAGEHNDWAETHGSEFAAAQEAAKKLMRENPEEAERQARESEGWMLEELRRDRETMAKVMTPEQIKGVDETIAMLEERLEQRASLAGHKRDEL